VTNAKEITSPPVRYTGSKWRIAPWVISHFPPHTCYVEPFCGGASVLFRKSPSAVEVINDLNGEVINFFEVLRNRPEDLIRAIDLTPFSRAELKLALTTSNDSLESARRLYIRARQSYTAGEAEKSRGWRFQKNMSRGPLSFVQEWANLAHLRPAAARLKMALIECDTALNILSRYDDPQALFYCDPPYTATTRTKRDYPLEMTDGDHIALSEALHGIKGMALISGYDCALYQELYADWRMVTKQAYTIALVARTECLWISPRASAAMGYGPLFGGGS